MKTKHIIKVTEFHGLPKLSDFKIVKEVIDETLKPGEILTEALAISVDPFIRAHHFPVGSTVVGFQVSKVLKSEDKKYPKGSVVMFPGGWRTVSKTKGEMVWVRVDNIAPKVETTHAVGSIGMPGLTAHIGFTELCRPKEGETVFVNGSAGAVGSIVGQIAKIMGCKVYGACGSDEKVQFAKSIGFDGVFNYKTEKDFAKALKTMVPGGIDCFFDNVGGQMASDVMAQMNKYGRVACCGWISGYNSTSKPQADIVQPSLIGRRLNVTGFMISDPHFFKKFPESIKQMNIWIHEGKLKVRETITDGFENLPKAFIGMLCGENIGKAVVRMDSINFTAS